jgi:hypothetical protein
MRAKNQAEKKLPAKAPTLSYLNWGEIKALMPLIGMLTWGL